MATGQCGAVLDILRLPDGQQITSMVTRRTGIEAGDTVPIGMDPQHVIPQED